MNNYNFDCWRISLSQKIKNAIYSHKYLKKIIEKYLGHQIIKMKQILNC